MFRPFGTVLEGLAEPGRKYFNEILENARQGITYCRGLWHHAMTVLDETAQMVILMWCDGSSDDEEFLDVDTPFEALLPEDV